MLLKQPLTVNGLMLSNRLVMPPMHASKSTDNTVSPELCGYYRQRAAGGAVGLVITEFTYICEQGKAGPTQLSMASDDVIPQQKALVDAIHGAGSKAFAQINHAGSRTKAEWTGQPTVAPSEMDGARELTVPEILEIENQFVAAALRAKAAGFDGVELHSAHGYLLNQFYSPLTNHRTDAYGGSLENRLRIHLETLQKVRAAVGPDYPLAVRLGGCDYQPGGSTVEDSVAAAVLLQQAGADLMDLSGGMCGYTRRDGGLHKEPGYFRDMSEAVKAAVTVPVLLTGGVTEAGQAEQLLQENAADLIGVGRALFRDGDWAAKAMA